MQKKVCFKCGKLKPLSEFYVHGQMADKHLNKCKECTKRDVREHRAANLEEIRAYDRERGQLEHRKKANRARAPRYADKRTEYQRRYRDRRPETVTPHNIVNAAIRDGKLKVEPCERCGFALGIQAHHEDYSKPLDVTWLCRKCHGERHREINEERRRSAA